MEPCVMCLESLSFGNSYIVTTPCGHLFHKDCLKKWLDTGKKTCPKCRTEIPRDPNELTRIYLSPSSFTNCIQNPQQGIGTGNQKVQQDNSMTSLAEKPLQGRTNDNLTPRRPAVAMIQNNLTRQPEVRTIPGSKTPTACACVMLAVLLVSAISYYVIITHQPKDSKARFFSILNIFNCLRWGYLRKNVNILSSGQYVPLNILALSYNSPRKIRDHIYAKD